MAFTERSAASRTAILDAARRRFAEDGYERATIRSIAAEAAIDPSMVIRYFGSKAELYAAASAIDLAVPDLGDADDAAAAYVESFLARWEAAENTAEAVLLRTAPTHPDAAARVQAVFDQEIVPALEKVLPDDPAVRERAALLLSQTLGIVYGRYLLGLEPLASMDVHEIARMATEAARIALGDPRE
ncbi:TetR family transcriptional regulator [Actinomadura mexicana]|uniref:Transcriptional regulator, TetR family n=1 Tax=Actinomadura mexicana TaxID=134959 RepID=A0A238VXU0_9ACTN|nr:TetR family transcriptional regulator [Actinomadura mexicana]SNR39058.1 transcriptional regulator, TetR family [Actinomadura mexicana]